MKLSEKGFTYIELIIAITITSLVVAATSMVIFQVLKNSERNSNHMTAVNQVQNAGYWIGRDTQMAQIVTTDGLPSPDFLVLSWTDGDSDDECQVVYTLEDMPDSGLKVLMRNQSINGGEAITTMVARYINHNSENTTCQFISGTLNLTITATVGAGSHMESESRTYQLIPKSS